MQKVQENIKTRESNIELMRIVLFVMIVSIHVFGPYLADNHYVGTINWQVANVFDGASRLAVDCFVLITGYFMYSQKNSVVKQVLGLIKKLLFFLIPYLILYLLFMDGNAVLKFIDNLLKSGTLFYHLWYIQLIIIMYILSPFLNKFIENINKKEHKKINIILFFIFSAVPSICYLVDYNIVEISQFYSNLGLFVFLYLVGAYIGKYENKNDYNTKKLLILLSLCIYAIVFLTFLYNSRFSPLIYFNNLRGIEISYPFNGFVSPAYAYNSIYVITSAVLMFKIFLSINLKSEKINKIAKSTFGAYILHVFWIDALSHIDIINPFSLNNGIYPIVAVIFLLIVCLLSITSSIAGNKIMKILRLDK